MKRVCVFAVLLLGVAVAQDSARQDWSKCKPVSERHGDGCWILTDASIGELPREPMFWHLDQFPTRAAAEAGQGKTGTMVEALGKVWLLTIADSKWRARGGKHIASVGPLAVKPGVQYHAQYLEATMLPGWTTPVHRHPGPEAFYTETGETCLETPQGTQTGRKNVNVIVPEGEPMRLSVTGNVKRRSIALILYDSAQPWVTMAHDWTPKGLCGQPRQKK